MLRFVETENDDLKMHIWKYQIDIINMYLVVWIDIQSHFENCICHQVQLWGWSVMANWCFLPSCDTSVVWPRYLHNAVAVDFNMCFTLLFVAWSGLEADCLKSLAVILVRDFLKSFPNIWFLHVMTSVWNNIWCENILWRTNTTSVAIICGIAIGNADCRYLWIHIFINTAVACSDLEAGTIALSSTKTPSGVQPQCMQFMMHFRTMH